MSPRLPRGRCLPLLFTGLYLACGPSLLTAQFVWDGGSVVNDLWSTDENWNPDGTKPTGSGSDTEELQFTAGTAAIQDLSGQYELNVLRFTGALGASSFVHSGNTASDTLLFDRFNGSSGNQPDIFKSHTGNATISNNIVIDDSGGIGNLQIWGSASGTLTLSGTITASGGGLGARITKFNGFDLVLSNAGNSLNGRIRIRGTGTLESQADGALDSPFIQIRENATLGITTVSQTYDEYIQIENGQTGNVDVASGLRFTLDGSGTGSASGDYLELGNATSVFDKEGLGELIVDGSGDGAGAVNIRAGTMEIRKVATLGLTTGSTTVISGATLDLNGNGSNITFAAEPLTISGVGVGSLGALRNTGDGGTGNVWTGTVTLGADSNIGVASGTDLEISGVIADGASTFDITKVENGILELSATNTFDGNVNINAGALQVDNGAAIADTASVTLANVSGAIFELLASETIGDLSGGGTTGGNVDLNANTLTTGDASTTIYSGDISGTGALTKQGSGTFTLDGTNTYSGPTTINAGTLRVDNGSAIADTASVTLANVSGAFFELLANETIGDLSGGDTTGGNVDLNANTLTTGDASSTTYSGNIDGAGALIKQGSGTFTLGGANTYAGTTTINTGTLSLLNAAGLGTSAAGTTVTSGATLDLAAAVTVTGESLTLNGTGVGGNGALTTSTVAGNRTWTGSVTLASASTIGIATGNLIISGAVGDSGGTPGLTKIGSGGLRLSGTNTFDGDVTINAGTLQVQNGAAIADTASVSLANTAATNFVLLSSETIGDLSGGGVTGGNVNLNGNTLTTGDPSSTTYSGAISGTGALIKQGSGTFTLNGTNTYTGTTTVNAGNLTAASNGALGTTAAGTSVSSGGTLALSGGVTITGETLTLNGSGASGSTGALHNESGNNTWDSDITLSSDSTISAKTAAQQLTLGASNADSLTIGSNTVTFDGAGNIFLNSQIGGTGNLIKNGNGTITLNWGGVMAGPQSSHSGTTTVNDGTLILNLGTTASQPTLIGTLTVGDGDGTDFLETRWHNQIGDSTTVNVNSTGTFTVNADPEDAFLGGDLTEIIGPLNLQGGATVTTNDGTSRNATVQLNDTVTRTSTGSSTATISGRLSLGASTRTFSVADEGTSTNELDVSALVSGTGGLTKTGSGVMTLSGTTANTYSGTTTVNTGILALNKSAGTDAIFGDLTIGDQSGTDVVRLDASNQFDTNSDILFNGGTLDLNGNSEADLGTIDVDFNSNIDFSGASGKITFDDSSAVIWATGVLIEADNWVGRLSGNGAEELEVSSAGLTATQLGQVRFTNVATTISARDHHAVFSSGDANELVPLDSNEFIWDKDVTAGSWDTGTNWLAGHAPDSTLARAVFTESGLVGNVTVSGGSDVAFDLNRLIFRDTSTRTITVDSGNAYTLTLNNDGVDGPQIVVESGSGAKLVGSDIVLSANVTITHSVSSGDLTLSGVISESGGARTLTKAGSGTVVLNGTNTYTGTTSITEGVLDIGNAAGLGDTSAGATVSDGATLSLSGSLSFNAEALTLNGAGVSSSGALLNESGANTWTGTVALNTASSIGANTSTSLNISGAVSGANALTKVGAGTVKLSGSNGSFTGDVNVNVGTLQVENGSAVDDSATVTLANTSGAVFQTVSNETIGDLAGGGATGGQVSLNASTTLSTGTATGSTYAGSITGSGNLIKQGSGTMVLTDAQGSSGYTGTSTVSDGVLEIEANTALGASGSGQGTSVTSGASLTLDGIGLIIAEPLTLNGNGDSGNGALRYISTTGSGTSTVSGTVSLASDSRIRVDDAGDNLVLSGVVSGSNALEKTGSGTLELQGTNTFSGTTTINDGVLRLDNSGGNALAATTQVTINSGGTLLFDRANQVTDTADLALAGGTFSTAGFSETMDNLTLTATSTIDMGAGASILNFSDGTYSAGTFTVKNWSGNFAVGGGTDQIIFAASLDQAFLSKVFWDDLGKTGAKQLPSGEIVPIPEPSTVIGGIFLGLVVAGDIYRRYRQRRRQD